MRMRRILPLALLLGAAVLAACGPPDQDGDAFPQTDDCDDQDPTVFPGAPELCDGLDNNCNGVVDELPPEPGEWVPTWYFDRDADGFGDPGVSERTCEPRSDAWVADGTDCDDVDGDAYPGGVEVCDGSDNDCDGAVDEGSDQTPPWYADLDRDGFGDADDVVRACFPPADYIDEAGDCDDADPAVFPGAVEVCNGVDDDCDGTVDEDGAVDGTPTYLDSDGDGRGDPETRVLMCAIPSDRVTDGLDCDDDDPGILAGCTCSDRSDGDLIVLSGESTTLDSGPHHFGRFEVERGAEVSFRGRQPVRIYADEVVIAGDLRLVGSDGVSSAFGSPGNGGEAAPGGGGGGGGGNCGNGAGFGGEPNGKAGSARFNGAGGDGGLPMGLEELAPDVAPARGGLGAIGGGGGAIQIVAARLDLTGSIAADGGDGGVKTSGGCTSGGGGGGAGGSVWLHADRLRVTGRISARGGRGGSGALTGNGGGAAADGRIRMSGLTTQLEAERISPSAFVDGAAPACPRPDDTGDGEDAE